MCFQWDPAEETSPPDHIIIFILSEMASLAFVSSMVKYGCNANLAEHHQRRNQSAHTKNMQKCTKYNIAVSNGTTFKHLRKNLISVEYRANGHDVKGLCPQALENNEKKFPGQCICIINLVFHPDVLNMNDTTCCHPAEEVRKPCISFSHWWINKQDDEETWKLIK